MNHVIAKTPYGIPEQLKCLMNRDLLRGYAQGRGPYGVCAPLESLLDAHSLLDVGQLLQVSQMRVRRDMTVPHGPDG